MYTPRAIFSRLFLQICPFVLSLYALGRLVTLSCEISDNLLSHASTVIIESEGRIWSVYIHNVNPKMRLKDMAMWVYKTAAGYNRKWRSAVRENPTIVLDSYYTLLTYSRPRHYWSDCHVTCWFYHVFIIGIFVNKTLLVCLKCTTWCQK